MKKRLIATLLACCFTAAAEAPTYVNDFEQAEVGATPADVMVLMGDFSVRREKDNSFLELPGAPLESFGLFVGPEKASPSACGARIYGTRTGKRFPEFGVGLGGASGFKLWLMPAVNELQIVRNDQVLAAVPYSWASGTWTVFRLQIRPAGEGKWRVEGKAWESGKTEPAAWMVGTEVTQPPPQGRASLWGVPYAETPIRFDDLVVGAAR